MRKPAMDMQTILDEWKQDAQRHEERTMQLSYEDGREVEA